jgi:mono/diheme cytochrome c family protein
MKWLITAVALTGIGVLVYFYIMFQGPRMQVQPGIRAYEQAMLLPPRGIVPVEPDPHAVPSPEQARGLINPVSDNQQNRDRGKVYYEYYCVFCHGRNGQGDGPVGYSYMPVPADLHDPKVLQKSDGELLRGMLAGIGHEPVLQRIVLPGHRWYLVTYVRALGKTQRVPAEHEGEQVLLRNGDSR